MRRLTYRSQALIVADQRACDIIVAQSVPRNLAAAITGVLWSNGKSFVQALEGDHEAVGDLVDRIRRDPRHHQFEIVSDQSVRSRLFGSWAMVSLTGALDWANRASFLTDCGSDLQTVAAEQLINAFRAIGTR